MSAPLVVALELGLLLVTGLVAGRTRGRIALAALLGAVIVGLPLLLPRELPWLRALMALASIFPVLRTIEIAVARRDHPAWLRAFSCVAPLDAFAITRVAPRFDARGFASALAWGALGAGGWAMVWLAPSGALRWPVAALGCALGLYGTMDALAALDRGLLRALGLESPPVQDTPIASRTIAELWGRRWNRAVGGWLRTHCFAPLARRRHAVLGAALAFAASAALHFWPVYVAVGLIPALAMAGFFAVQAIALFLESRLGVGRWRRAAGHAWTLSVMLLSSPLFTVPMLLILGFRG